MSNKIMYDRGDKEMLPARIFIGFIMLIVFLHMFFIKSGDGSVIHTETLWKAVHPYHWLFDTLGTLGFIAFCLFLTGYLGKFVTLFKDVSVGAIKVVAGIAIALMVLWYV